MSIRVREAIAVDMPEEAISVSDPYDAREKMQLVVRRGRTPARGVNAAPRHVETGGGTRRSPITVPRMVRRWGADAAVATGLALAVALVFAQVRGHAFVNFDDPLYVTANPTVRRGLTWQGVRWAFTSFAAQNWHPVTWLSHMLDVTLFGVRAGPHLLMNVAWHTLNTGLVYALWRWVTGRRLASAAVAVLFAVHPAHVESVAWLSERKDVLSTAFGLGAMLGWVWWVRRPSVARYGLVFVLATLGLLAKPMLVTLPVLLALLDFWPLGRFDRFRGRLVAEKVPFLVPMALVAAATMVAQSSGGAMASMSALPLGERLANAVLAYLRYLGVLFWPVDLALVYPLEVPVPRLAATLSALTLAAITAVVLAQRRARPYLLAGWLWYLVTLAPVIGIVQVGDQAMADRYTYLPFVGLFVMLAFGGDEMAARSRVLRAVVAGMAAVAVMACLVLAHRQTARWRDSETIFRHTLSVTRNNHLAHQGLALALTAAGRYEEAVAEHRAAARAWPDYFEAHWGAGLLLERLGRIEDAVADLAEAARLRPDVHLVRYAYGKALWSAGRVGEALEELRAAVRLAPGWVPGATLLSWLLATSPDPSSRAASAAEAVAVAERAAAGPRGRDPDLLDSLAAAYAAAGRFEEAVAAAARAADAARAARRPDLAASIDGRRALYARGEAYVEAER